MRPTAEGTSLAGQAERVALVGMVLIAALPAALAICAGWITQQQRAEASAMVIAWMVERQPSSTNTASTDALPSDDLAALADLPAIDSQSEARDIYAADGRILASRGDAASRAWPSLVVPQELRRGGEVVGRVHIVRSLRPAFSMALALGLAGIILAMTLWITVFMRPIGVLRKTEGRLKGYARHDALTGLYNLDGLRVRLQRALSRRQASAQTVAVLVVDLDRFRIVNDSLGHPCGDALLRNVADRIRAVTRPSDVAARLGADQFGILVEGIGGAAAAAGMARNLLRALAPSYVLGDKETVVGLSVGVAVASEEADTADALLKCADAAMRAAKADGGGRFKLYETAMNSNLQQRLDTELNLRRALRQDEFFLLYQPILDIAGKNIIAVEALLRWADPEQGVVSPADFIPILEETGLIVAAGRWALSEACKSGASWRAMGGADLLMSVNVSPRQFAEADFVTVVDRVLAETGFPAAQLQLEVTEGLLLAPTEECLAKIDALAMRGVRLAIDDFGVGYSSLAYLQRFNLHSLKIDRMFVRDIAIATRDAAIVRAIIELGHGLGIRVTAEGVETEEQFNELRRLGCDALQGYLFARPMEEDELMRQPGWRKSSIVPRRDAALAPFLR